MATTKPAAPPSIGELIDKLVHIRDQRRLLAEEDKKLTAQYAALEQNVIDDLDKQQLTGGRGSGFTASVTDKTTFSVPEANWATFVAYAVKKKLTHLLYKRVSNPACQEQLELKHELPGVEKFTSRSLSLRKL